MRYGVILVMILGVILSSNMAYGAQLEAEILNDASTLEPSFKFLRVIYVENLEGGDLDEMISDSTIKFEADSKDTDLSDLISQINKSLKESESIATVKDVKLTYQAIISKQKDSATIEYNIEITPTITDHIGIDVDRSSVFVDSKWRGFSIDEPIIIETLYGNYDVNSPASVLKVVSPNAYAYLKDVDVMLIPLIDASGILELPMSKWHYLFDPTAIQASKDEYGYKGNLTSEYSMGECTIAIGTCDDREWSNTITLDKEYTVRAIESRDDAVISIEGYTTIYRGTEFIGVSEQREDSIQPGGFQTSVIYGMAIVGAIGAVVFFWFSNRKIKNEKDTGQTGIDPARLQARETSSSAGGYKTNRGESHLASELSNLPYKNESKMPV